MVFFWIVHNKKLFKRSFSEGPTWSRRKLSKYSSTHGKNPETFGAYNFWTIKKKAISLMFETETVGLCLVGKLKCVCVCVCGCVCGGGGGGGGGGERKRGIMPPWPPSGCAPVYIKCWFKGLFVLRWKKQCNTGTSIVSSRKSYVHKRSKHDKSLWSLNIKKFWEV